MRYEDYQRRVDKEQILEEIAVLASDSLPGMSPSYYLERLEEIRELDMKGIGRNAHEVGKEG